MDKDKNKDGKDDKDDPTKLNVLKTKGKLIYCEIKDVLHFFVYKCSWAI